MLELTSSAAFAGFGIVATCACMALLVSATAGATAAMGAGVALAGVVVALVT